MGAARKIKQEYLLEGLDCANCAAKIENGVSKVKGVDNCSVNFATKTISFDVEEQQHSEVSGNAKKVITKLEPGIDVRDKNQASKSKVFLLEGLDCANCAAKVEKHVGKMDGVASSNVDFVSKKLTVELNTADDLSETIKQTVTRLEPHIHPKEMGANQSRGHDHDDGHGHDHSHEGGIKPLITRLVIGSIISIIPFLGDFIPGVEIALFAIGYLIIGGDIVWRAIRNISRGQVFDEHFLMSIATIGAFLIGEYPEGIAVMLFFQVGELFQSIAVNRSRNSISELMDIRPDYANLQVDGETKTVSPEEVKVGDYIVVKPGEKVPLDGKVVKGNSLVDTSALTGESLPRDVEAGSDVLSGFINKNGVITVEVTKPFADSTVSKILELVQNASGRKAPTEKFITKFARYYTPVVVIIAALVALIPPLVVPGATFSEWIYRALIFLVISCPCALVVSIPLGFFGGIGGAAKQGILVKGANYLEALNSVKYAVFDKTGTLTKGVFQVTHVEPSSNVTKDELLEYAAYAEVHSNHPIATSILNAYEKQVNEAHVLNYNEVSGHGIEVEVNGKQILAGNSKLMVKENIEDVTPSKVGTVVHVAVDHVYAGHIIISDEIKDDAIKAIKELKALGIKKTVMLTGDSKAVATEVSEALQLDEFYAELLPHEKVEMMEKIDEQKLAGEKSIFVGDGINDTPVLARADIGVAMGGLGSDAAIEAADVVIMTDEPSRLADGIRKARYTRKIVWQNISLALGIKAIVLLLGVLGLATMWEAIISDVGVTLLAVLNSMRVLRNK
ncbi:heavy metal translocating P-type ATPase [Aquibacillus salsiterrae]|uniref:Cadmium-translocating P-type ATPase n=1 Tax=Aquibacillus salsiterrae TaxID=2950439 RepID=A0A9X3WBR7_9BACI|nr:heavy metal translocating P-type ATPase [Aquibacillus salsiterrae]MDC3416765.1 cadmium-translocating P-type ATPase [Aquibacillus salsiterrae]